MRMMNSNQCPLLGEPGIWPKNKTKHAFEDAGAKGQLSA
jgi:hypothetical protein